MVVYCNGRLGNALYQSTQGYSGESEELVESDEPGESDELAESDESDEESLEGLLAGEPRRA